jgi:hypothetical protein
MASLTFAQTLAQVNIVLGDTANSTFTPEEKTRALTKAWNDEYVVNDVWDTTGTYSVSNYQTAVPTALSAIKDIGVKVSTSDFPESVDSSLYDIVGSNIQWTQNARYTLTDGTGIYVLGTKKLTVDDVLPTVALQEYVIALGAYETLTLLGYKKANLFLKNDTSMGELIALKRELERDVKQMRSRFARSFQPI